MGYTEETIPKTNEAAIDAISTSCDPIKTNADLANMGITEYFWSSDESYGITYCNPNLDS